MSNVKPLVFVLFIFLLVSSCMNLDSNVFNGMELQVYKGDLYEGNVEVDLRSDPNYTLEENLVSYFNYSSEGETVYAVYLGDIDRIQTDTVILYCHGNAGHMDNYWSRAKLLAFTGGKNRFGVLMMDYRGYGMSTGTPSEEGLIQDVEGSLKWLKDKGLTPDRLILYGYSLGSYPATTLTAENSILRPGKLILEAPFASTEIMVRDASGLLLPYQFFTSQKLNNSENIKKVNQEFLWIHGIDDSFLSISSHGETVFANYKGSYGKAIRVSGAEHSDIPRVMGLENYKINLLEFILH